MIEFKIMFFLNYSTLVDPLLRDLRVYTPKFSRMKAGDMVLDVCCGTGAQILEYAQRGPIAVGVDNDPAMLRVAKGNIMKQKLENVSFQLAAQLSHLLRIRLSHLIFRHVPPPVFSNPVASSAAQPATSISDDSIDRCSKC